MHLARNFEISSMRTTFSSITPLSLDVILSWEPCKLLIEKKSKLDVRTVCETPGPNFQWHLDGWDKRKPYGFRVHGCADSFSWCTLRLQVGSTNKDPNDIVELYVSIVFDCVTQTYWNIKFCIAWHLNTLCNLSWFNLFFPENKMFCFLLNFFSSVVFIILPSSLAVWFIYFLVDILNYLIVQPRSCIQMRIMCRGASP